MSNVAHAAAVENRSVIHAVSVPHLPALAGAMNREGSAQRRALTAWHQASPMLELDQAIATHARFPLIVCSDQGRCTDQHSALAGR